jgi:Bacterial Ig domain
MARPLPVLRSIVLCLTVLALSAPAGAAVLEVEGPQDSLAGAPTINHCTLRKAVINANEDSAPYPQCAAGSGLDTITIPAGMTITFALAGNDDTGHTGDLDITDNLIIMGNGATVDGNDLDRIFHVHPGITVTIYDLNIVNGNGNGGGGGISITASTLNLHNVTISGCSGPNGDGGAISADSVVLSMTNCTVSGNTAAHHAGAIIINSGTASITNSTITGNDTGFANLCGGIRNTGTTTLRNSIVAGNGPGNDLPNLDGVFTSLGYNVIGALGSVVGTPTFVPTVGDQTGVTPAAVNLGPLQSNGGSGVRTHALLAGSVARDKGHASGSTTDARGLTRPCDDAGIANATGGDGGDVGAHEEQVACANAAPNANDDVAVVAEDSNANVINVLTNDTDPTGDPLSVSSVTQGAHGTVTHNGSTVSYKPQANFSGNDTFTYTISDGFGSDTATVFVTVTNVNDAPVAVGESYNMNQGSVLTVPAPGVLANDTDIDGNALTPLLCTTPVHGTLVMSPNGGFTYTPHVNYFGPDWFTYRAFDGLVSSGCVTVMITIASVDSQPPVITASVATSMIWPPNGKLVDVGLSVSASDASGATTTVTVYSDEDDGATPDAAGMLTLRAERDPSGDGRVYLIVVKATDAHGNTSHNCLTVIVPKSQSAADLASVNAQAAAADAYCDANGTAPPGWFVVGN